NHVAYLPKYAPDSAYDVNCSTATNTTVCGTAPKSFSTYKISISTAACPRVTCALREVVKEVPKCSSYSTIGEFSATSDRCQSAQDGVCDETFDTEASAIDQRPCKGRNRSGKSRGTAPGARSNC